jgi:glutathione S-transferase
LEAWEKRVYEREAVQKGADVPDKYTIKELLKNPAEVEKKAAEARKWIQAGMKEDAEKNKK